MAFTGYAGIGPTPTQAKHTFFDMLTGQFTSLQPLHPDFLEPDSAMILNRLLQISAEEVVRNNFV